MPRPKGCTCGTPKPCKLHSAERAGRGVPPGDDPGGRPQGAPAHPVEGAVAGAVLGVIEGGAGRPQPDPKPRRPDPAPKPRKRTSRAKVVAPDAPDDAALVDMLGQLLTMPAIPAAMLLNCEFCRDHFITEGPKAARELVALSIANPALRGALESLHAGFTKLTIAGVLAGYLAKPLMHHVAPEPVLSAAGPVLGVPPRPEKPEHEHASDPQAEHPGAGGTSSPHQHSGDTAPRVQAA